MITIASHRPLTVLIVLAPLLGACVTVDVKLSNFMSPDRGPRTAALAPGYAVQDLVLHRGDRAIGITHAHHPQSRAVIVFCGGDQFRRSVEGGEALEVLARDADVILFDYPGYGDSTGALSAATILETALAVYDYASTLETSAGKKRVIYGFSIGGMVAAQVASLRDSEGVVLESTAPNAESWARRHIPWYAKPLVTPRVEPSLESINVITALSHYRGETLVLGGAKDQQAPASLSADIYRALLQRGVKAEIVEFRGASHGAIPHAAEYHTVLRNFLARVPERP